MQSRVIPIIGVVVLALVFSTADCSGQSLSDLSGIISSLSPELQQSLSNLADNTTNEQPVQPDVVPLPHGREALRAARENNPGQKVKGTLNNVSKKANAARAGEPDYGFDEIVIPEDKPDFWDRVKKVFLLALMEAFGNITTQQ